jgi:hypothetical protein
MFKWKGLENEVFSAYLYALSRGEVDKNHKRPLPVWTDSDRDSNHVYQEKNLPALRLYTACQVVTNCVLTYLLTPWCRISL